MKVTDNTIYWARSNKDVIIPTKRNEDMGYDIFAYFEEDKFVIPSHSTRLVPTGLHCAMSEDYGLELGERGSTGSKGIKASAGKIDSGYRGEIFVALTNTNDKPVIIMKKDSLANYIHSDSNNEIIYPYEKAICQGIIKRVYKMNEKEIPLEELLSIESDRGTGKLGSSGK